MSSNSYVLWVVLVAVLLVSGVHAGRVSAAGGPAAIQPVTNGAFEDGLRSPKGWAPNVDRKWTKSVWDKAAGIDGTSGVQLETSEGAPAQYWPMWQQSIALPKGQMYGALRLSGWLRAENVKGTMGGYLAVEYIDAKGRRIDYCQSGGVRGDSDWVPMSAYGSLPEGTVKLTVNCILFGTGKVSFDAISMALLPRPTAVDAGVPVALRLDRPASAVPFLGYGIEYDPWAFSPEVVQDSLDKADYDLLDSRLDALSPRVVRVFLDLQGWAPAADRASGGTDDVGTANYTPDSDTVRSTLEVLRRCQSVGASVNLVMWRPNDWTSEALPKMTQAMADFADFAVRDRGLGSLKWITLYNEPDNEFPLGTREYVRMYRLMREALDARGLAVGLIGADAAASEAWFASTSAELDNVVAMHSFHHYAKFAPSGQGSAMLMDGFVSMLRQKALTKPVVLWEFNVQGPGAGTFTPGEGTPGKLTTEHFTSAIQIAELSVAGMNSGASGMCYWEIHDMHYPGGSFMEYGLFASKAEGWTLRPAYYLYLPFMRFVEPGATALASQGDLPAQLTASGVENPDGTASIFIVNRSASSQSVVLAGARQLSDGQSWRRFDITEASTSEWAAQRALLPSSTPVALVEGSVVAVPAGSLVVLTTSRR